MSAISTAVDRPAVAEPGTITLSEWDEDYSQRNDAYELVQGVPTAAHVEPVVEVLSPDSIERDRVTKKREYAQTGIPMYLIVDRFAERLILFTDPHEGAYHALTSTDGATPLTLRLGQHTIKITLADLT